MTMTGDHTPERDQYPDPLERDIPLRVPPPSRDIPLYRTPPADCEDAGDKETDARGYGHGV